jgi:hypothetical protein
MGQCVMSKSVGTLNASPWNTREDIALKVPPVASCHFSDNKRLAFHTAVRVPSLAVPVLDILAQRLTSN